MDSNASLELILSAIAAETWHEEASEACDGLKSWVGKGGFLPDRIRGIVADIRGESYEMFAACPESFECDDDIYLDYRLYIRPDGSMDIAVGDPCFDTDHRGYCGAGTIARHDTKMDIADSVMDAFFQAVDMYVECGPELKAE